MTSRPAPLSARPVVQLPTAGNYLLLSDLHLGDGGKSDQFGRKDDLFVAMLDCQSAWADAVILNGDTLDAVQCRRPDRIRKAHPAVIAKLEALARRIPVYNISGNHDETSYASDLLPSVRWCPSIRLGETALIVHGHQFDAYFGDGPLAGSGGIGLGAHAFVERLTGQLIRVPFSDFDNAVNRFAHWFFYRFTMASYWLASLLAKVGWIERLKSWAALHDYWARSQWGDSQALLLPALAALATIPYQILIVGHTHQAGLLDRFASQPVEHVSGEPNVNWRPQDRRSPDIRLLEHRVLANLGSWTGRETTVGAWRGNKLQMTDWATGLPVGDRSFRKALDAAVIPGMREWWQRYYRGFLRYDIDAIRRDRCDIELAG